MRDVRHDFSITAFQQKRGGDAAAFFVPFAVLYHQSQAKLTKTLAEARRVLKPGGLLGTRDADVGGNILYPELDGVRLALGLWQRWYEHDDPEALLWSPAVRHCSRSRLHAGLGRRKLRQP